MSSSAFAKKKPFYNNKGGDQKLILNAQLINEDTIILSGPFALFTEDLKKIIKEHGGRYNPEEKGWFIQRQHLDDIRSRKLEVPVNKMPNFVNNILRPLNGQLSISDNVGTRTIEYAAEDLQNTKELPAQFNEKLYSFQSKGVEFGIKNFGRVLIADEMGVGKTIQALALACLYKQDWPILIITPSSLKLNWKDEIYKWIDGLEADDVQVVTKSNVDVSKKIRILIASYDLASKMNEVLEKTNFQTIIVDEAHYLKNTEAKRTENLVPIIKRAKRIILLTGTPALARPKEIYNLLNILRPDVFSNFKDFGNRYCDPKPNRWSGGIDYSGADNIKELHYILTNSVMIRRLKRDVLTELPPKRRQKIEVKAEPAYVK